MKQYQCPKCGEVDCLVCVVTEIHHYNIFPNEHGDKEYEGYSDVVHGQIETILCNKCSEHFSEDQLQEMIVSTGEEE